MTFLKLNNYDVSPYVNELTIEINHNHVSQVNASGDMVVDRLSTKRTITVGFIPMSDLDFKKSGLQDISRIFEVSVTYYEPGNTAATNSLPIATSTAKCILPTSQVEYYTLQGLGNASLKAFTFTFTEL